MGVRVARADKMALVALMALGLGNLGLETPLAARPCPGRRSLARALKNGEVQWDGEGCGWCRRGHNSRQLSEG